MTGRRLLIALSLLALCAPASAAARIHPRPIVGIGDQQPDMFATKRWRQLKIHDARYVAPWDVIYDSGQNELLNNWLEAAGRAHVRAVIGFAHSLRTERLAHTLPTWRQFKRAFQLFRQRYPFVKNFIAWNEANSPGALTATHPHRAAQYYDVMVKECRGCAIAAADVLDTKTVVHWIKQFKRSLHRRARIWGLHNYSGANHLSTRGTRRVLANTRGTIWFTETGGVVLRRELNRRGKVRRTFRYGVKHAAASTSFALKLSCLSPRISRVYLYEWQAPLVPTTWDSGLISGRGKLRPAYHVLQNWRKVSLRMSPRRARAQLCRGFP
jgi:polysaccharide biosynthesis protein PslG